MSGGAIAAPPTATDPPPAAGSDAAGLIRRHGIWAAVGRAVNAAAVFGGTVLLARLLSQADFARFNVFRTVLAVAGIAAGSGLGVAALRRVGEALERGDGAAARRAAGAGPRLGGPLLLFGSALAAGVTWWMGERWFGAEAGWPVAAAAAVGTLALGGMQIASETLRGCGGAAAANLLGGVRGAPLVNALLLLAAGGLWLAGSLTLTSAVWAYAVVAAAVFPVAVWLAVRAVGGIGGQRSEVIGRSELSEAWAVAWPTTLATLLSFASVQFDQLVAPTALPAAESDAYVAARRVVLLAMFPLSVLNSTAAGLVSRLYGSNRAALGNALRAGATLVAAPCVLFYAVALVAPEWTCRLVLGAGYESSAGPLRWLVPGHLVLTLTGSCGLVLTLTGHQRSYLLVNAAALVLLLTAGPWACRWGGVGLAAAVSGVVGLQNAACWLLARRNAGLDTAARLTLLVRPRDLRGSLRPRPQRDGGED